MGKQVTEEKTKVMCTYCGKIELVDKWIVEKLNETTAFCCKECITPAMGQK